MGVSQTLTSWNSRQAPISDPYWGPISASIDWCEENYAVSRHVAEFINTISNLPFLCMAYFGIYSSIQNKIPVWLWLPFAGIAMVGTGSFFFHMTLSYRMQLLDELPMLFAATFTTYCVWNTQKPGQRQPVPYIGLILFTLVASVTAAYLYHPDPILHQAAFACILISAVARASYLTKTSLLKTSFELARNREFVKMQATGSAIFAAAFGIWLVDCFACDHLTHMKNVLGAPLAWLLEFHAWWHLGTGLGSFYLATSLQLLVLSLREDPRDFKVERAFFGLLPHVTRVSQGSDRKVNGTRISSAHPNGISSKDKDANGHSYKLQ